jgi:hypothetical protein
VEPAEVVLRLPFLKHIRNCSYEVVEREARASLIFQAFTRVDGGKVPITQIKADPKFPPR